MAPPARASRTRSTCSATAVASASAGRQEPEGRRLKILERKALETLDLPEAATGAEIKSRYKTLVKRLHPDANGGDRSSEEKLRGIIQAYNTLRSAGLLLIPAAPHSGPASGGARTT